MIKILIFAQLKFRKYNWLWRFNYSTKSR